MKFIIYLSGGIMVELLASDFNDNYQSYTLMYILLVSMIMFVVSFRPDLAEIRLRNIYKKAIEKSVMFVKNLNLKN